MTALLFVALAATVLGSLLIGGKPLAPEVVWTVLLDPDGSESATIIWELRIPRTITGIITGAAFGLSGALIQAITRNPLADPGILGVNAGAGLAITAGIGLFGLTSPSQYVWFAFLGAVLATVAVSLIGGVRGMASPVTLVLAGVALAAVLGGVSTLLSLINAETFRAVRQWNIGSIASTTMADIHAVLPFLLVGIVLSVGIAGSLNAVSLGDDLASALGARVIRTRAIGVVAVTLLAGGATALTGGLVFIGLMVPHIARWVVGPDQRRIMLLTALAAPALVLGADVLGRVIAPPGEIAVGVVSALIGAPVLMTLARRARASGL